MKLFYQIVGFPFRLVIALIFAVMFLFFNCIFPGAPELDLKSLAKFSLGI